MARQHAVMPANDQVIIEFYRVGSYVKVSAVDPVSGTEVALVGDPAAGEAALTQAAIRKLEYVMARAREAGRRRA